MPPDATDITTRSSAWQGHPGACAALALGAVLLIGAVALALHTAAWCAREIACIPVQMVFFPPLLIVGIALLAGGGMVLARSSGPPSGSAIDAAELMAGRRTRR